jgi:hypothetical protein
MYVSGPVSFIANLGRNHCERNEMRGTRSPLLSDSSSTVVVCNWIKGENGEKGNEEILGEIYYSCFCSNQCNPPSLPLSSLKWSSVSCWLSVSKILSFSLFFPRVTSLRLHWGRDIERLRKPKNTVKSNIVINLKRGFNKFIQHVKIYNYIMHRNKVRLYCPEIGFKARVI